MKELVISNDCKSGLRALSEELQTRVFEKLGFLQADPKHQSLNVHRLKRTVDKWECYIDQAHRLIYDINDKIIRIWEVGDHSIVDRVHRRPFSENTTFCRLEITEDEESAQVLPKYEFPSEYSEHEDDSAINPFKKIPDTHLRILGVPSKMIPTLRDAISEDEVAAIPGLPEHTLEWLLELMTNPELEDMLYSQQKLLYRTTLDHLIGYCKGEIKELMLNLEPAQQDYVDLPLKGSLLLKGCAGSGKTTVALYRAIKYAKTGEKTIFLTFNKTLARAAQTLLEELENPLPPNLEVKNIDAWITGLLRERNIPFNFVKENEAYTIFQDAIRDAKKKEDSYIFELDWTFFQEEIARVIKANNIIMLEDYLEFQRYGRKSALKRKARKAVWAVYEAYTEIMNRRNLVDWQEISILAYNSLAITPLPHPYKHVIIDEAQDLTPMQIKVAQRMMGGISNNIFLVGDVAQSLYSRGFTWKQTGLVLQGRSHALRKNFRNTKQIAEVAAKLNSYNVIIKSSEDFVDPEHTNKQGPYPILLEPDLEEDEIDCIINKILDLASDNKFRLSDFAILCPNNQLCFMVENELKKHKLPCLTRGDSSFDILEEKIKLLTIHSAKGLEFPVVFLLGLHEDILPRHPKLNLDEEEKELEMEGERTLMYVGMTRAADMLYLVAASKKLSRFVVEIEDMINFEEVKVSR